LSILVGFSFFYLFFFWLVSSLDLIKTGLLREPKWSHLKELHAAVQLCSDSLLQGIQTDYSAGMQQQVSIASIILPFLFGLY